MRIAVLHQDLFFQGGQKVSSQIANGLKSKGHHVDVIVSKVHSDIQGEHPQEQPFRLESGIALHILPNRKAMLNILALGRLLARLKPDVIIPNVGHYNCCAVLAKLIYRLKVPIVYVEHCMMTPTKSCVAKFCMRHDARIVCVSDGVVDLVKRSIGDIGNTIRIYSPALEGKPIDKDNNIVPLLKERECFTFVAAGEMNTARKGFDVIITAFARAHAVAPKTRLVLFGDGKMRSLLEAQVKDLNIGKSVLFAGFTTNIMGNMAYADALLFGSRNETFGLVLVEALYAGISVISTDCNVGPREILRGGRLGQLVPVDNPDAMAEAMIRLVRGEWSSSDRFDPTIYLESTAINNYEKLLKEVVK